MAQSGLSRRLKKLRKKIGENFVCENLVLPYLDVEFEYAKDHETVASRIALKMMSLMSRVQEFGDAKGIKPQSYRMWMACALR
jgi:hypothetical protein